MKFLEKLSHYIHEKYSGDFSHLTIVFPNNRAKIFFTNYLGQTLEKSTWMPKMMSSIELFEEISGSALAEDYILTTLLYQSLPPNLKEENGFDQFLSWAIPLLQDIKEIDHELADTDALFSSLIDIKRIEHWNVERKELSDNQKKYLNYCESLPSIYREFSEKLNEAGLAHSGLLERISAQMLSEYLDKHKSRFIVAGFNALTNAERSIFGQLVTYSQGEIIFDYDEFYVDDIVHEAGYFARKNINDWKLNPLPWTDTHFNNIPKVADIHVCSNTLEQVYALCEKLKTIHPESHEDTCIVLGEETLLIPLLSALPENIQQVNITMGYALKHSPFYGFFESIIRITLGLSSKPKYLYHKDLFRLLKDDTFISLLDKQSIEALKSLERDMLKKNRVFISVSAFNDLLPDSLKEKKWSIDENGEVSSLLRLIDLSIRLIDHQTEANTSLTDKISREFLLHHLDVITQIEKINYTADVEMNIQTFHKIWRHYHNINKVQFVGEPLSGLQIMGLLETRNLDFKQVYFLSLNEGQVPSSRQYGSIIPVDLRNHYGLMVHSERESVFAYHFYRLLQRAEKLDLFYHTKSGDFGGGEPSRYILQLKRAAKLMENLKLNELTVKSNFHFEAASPEQFLNNDGVRKRILELASNHLSPTALGTFIRCPKDFYFKYVLNLREDDEVLESAEAREFGSIVHRVLEKLYQPGIGQRLDHVQIQGMKGKYKGLLQAEFIEHFGKNFEHSGRNIISQNTAEKYIERFLDLDLQRVEHNNIQVLALEHGLNRSLEFEFEGQSYPLKLIGTMDRIELLNGQLHIIDYKTGKVEDKDLKFKSMEEAFDVKSKYVLQLLIYSWMTLGSEFNKSNKVAASIYSMRRYEKGFVPMIYNDVFDLPLDFMDELELRMGALVKSMAFEVQQFEHNEQSKFCEMC